MNLQLLIAFLLLAVRKATGFGIDHRVRRGASSAGRLPFDDDRRTMTLLPLSGERRTRRTTTHMKGRIDDPQLPTSKSTPENKFVTLITASPTRSATFSLLMAFSGAALGPFLDSFHSAFGVLTYNTPITVQLWGSPTNPALITSWWVPELFGLAGFLIGWLYLLLDTALLGDKPLPPPSPPKILVGISIFTFQYWLSGALYQAGVDRNTILMIMSLTAATGFVTLDGTFSGFLTSTATAVGGPLIEMGLLTLSSSSILLFQDGYHYGDVGETGFFPLWIVPVYFLGGPANGNLARGYWSLLSSKRKSDSSSTPTREEDTAAIALQCEACQATRCVDCPNCDGIGTYEAMGKQIVVCTSCNGRGFVICRACFNQYDEDPYDIDAIRKLMASKPD